MARAIEMFKISKRDNRSLEIKAINDLKYIRIAAKKEPLIIDMFKKNGRALSEIDDVSIQFVRDLEVSAKTINGKIYLNANMLDDDWKDYFHYIIHELSHYCDHKNKKCNDDNVSYLDNPAEISAFKKQLKYREKHESPKVIDKYLEELFDKHDLPEKERPAKKKELLGN